MQKVKVCKICSERAAHWPAHPDHRHLCVECITLYDGYLGPEERLDDIDVIVSNKNKVLNMMKILRVVGMI